MPIYDDGREKKNVFEEQPSFTVDKQMKEAFGEAMDMEDFSDNAPGVSEVTVIRLWSVSKEGLLAISNFQRSVIFLIVALELI